MADKFNALKFVSYYVCVYIFHIFIYNDPCGVFAGEIKRNHYVNGRILETIKPSGIQQCQKYCSSRTDCNAVHFHVSHLNCELVTDVAGVGVSREGFLSYEMERPSFCSALTCTGRCIETRAGNNFCYKCKNEGYTRYNSGYPCLWFSTTTKSWDNAEQDCRNKGGRLLVLNFQDSFQIFQQILYQVSMHLRSIWLGAQDVATDGEWRWTSNETVTFQLHENDNTNGNCLLFYMSILHDHICNSNHHYACEEL